MRPEYTWLMEPIRKVRVMTQVCDEYGITHEDLKGERKTQLLFRARMTYSFIMRKHFKQSLDFIARDLNRADHTAIINQLAVCEDLILKNDPIKHRIKRIEQQLLTKQLIYENRD